MNVTLGTDWNIRIVEYWNTRVFPLISNLLSSVSMPSLLEINDLYVSVEGKEIVRGVSLKIQEGEIHAIMGPNGSGKSTLVHALMGHPKYAVTKGSAQFRGKNLLAMEPEERARAGLFLAFQYPKEIAGVTFRSFLFAAHSAIHPEEKMSPLKFQKVLDDHMRALHMDPAFAERHVNKGFSGGEKKKAEVLQMAVLKPVLVLLDETDSGLDVDALRIVAEGVNQMKDSGQRTADSGNTNSQVPAFVRPRRTTAGRPSPRPSVLIVTHYARILGYVKPDHVHVMVQGKIVASGGSDFAATLEKEGYGTYGSGAETNKITLDL